MPLPAHALDIPLSKLLAYSAGGVGLAALENKYIGDNLPAPLQKVNLGIGATTGAMLASHNPAMQTAALGAIPIKEMGLFGVGSLDRFRRQQQSLVDTNLNTAKINESTATIARNDSGGRKALALAFLAPALAAGAGLGASGYLAWKHRNKAKANKFQTDASAGSPRSSQRIRIDIPPSALPKSWYQSLGTGTTDSREFARLQTKRPMNTKTASQQQPMTAPGFVKDLLWQGSGIPELHNAWREAGYGMNTAQQGDYGNAKRYGLAGAADAGLGLLALRYGVAPTALKLLGRARVGGVIRNQMAAKGLGQYFKSRQLTEMPTVAKWINHWGGEHQVGPMHLSPQAPAQGFVQAGGGYIDGASRMARRQALGMNTRTPARRALDISGRYDPQRYAFQNPTTSMPGFKSLLSSGNPRSLPGHAINVLRYGANRGVNAMYAGKQFVKRHPLLTGYAALPGIAAGGVVQDDTQRQHELEQNRPWFPDSSANAPSGQWMPASSMASNLLGAFGAGSPMAPLRHQFGG